jgi:indoleamine 2,3-dioxygenase
MALLEISYREVLLSLSILSLKCKSLDIALLLLKCYSAGFKPWMEYAGSYALYNYRLEDPARGLEYDNTRLIRAFEHGLDPTSSEAGFVLVHVAMVRHSGELVTGAMQALEGSAQQNRGMFDEGLMNVVSAMKQVNTTMQSKYLKTVTPTSAQYS